MSDISSAPNTSVGNSAVNSSRLTTIIGQFSAPARR
jgi:hypothetical protein